MTTAFFENPANAEKVQTMSILSDVYKMAYGFRPRGVYNAEFMSIEDINAEIATLSAIAKENADEEKRIAEIRAQGFRALVSKTIKMGAGDQKTALKWLFDAYYGDVPYTPNVQDFEQFVWENGFIFTDFGKEIVKSLNEIY